jgi:hypothetical protein
MSVGVMEDYKLRDLRASHTLGLWWHQSLLSSFFLGIDWFDSWAFGLDYQALW